MTPLCGQVHRDLKPENIMLVRRDGHDDFVKVLDFGLALVSRHIADDKKEEEHAETAPKITQVGEIFGTPAYMAPEQSVGERADIRADLYALGVMLYEMLAGVRPFIGSSSMALIQQHLAATPPRMKDQAPGVKVPEDIEAMVLKLLAKRPAERFRNPQELLACIDQLIAAHKLLWPPAPGDPVAESPPPPPAPPPETESEEPYTVSLTQTLMALRSAIAPVLERTRIFLFPKKTLGNKLKEQISAGWDKLRGKRPGLLARLGSLPRWLLIIGSFLGVLSLALSAISLWRRPPESTSEPPGLPAMPSSTPTPTLPPTPKPPRPRPLPKEVSASQADLDAAVVQGTAALEALSGRFPKDTRILHALVKGYSNQHQHLEAMAALSKLAALDPNAGRDLDMIHAIVAALQASVEANQAAAILIEQDLGEAGVELLYDLTVKQRTARWKIRLLQSLAKPEVIARGTLPVRLAIALRATRTCEAKREMLPKLYRDGDERSATQLKALTERNGCGFLGLGDCWSCLRKDNSLQETINAIDARTKEQPR